MASSSDSARATRSASVGRHSASPQRERSSRMLESACSSSSRPRSSSSAATGTASTPSQPDTTIQSLGYNGATSRRSSHGPRRRRGRCPARRSTFATQRTTRASPRRAATCTLCHAPPFPLPVIPPHSLSPWAWRTTSSTASTTLGISRATASRLTTSRTRRLSQLLQSRRRSATCRSFAASRSTERASAITPRQRSLRRR